MSTYKVGDIVKLKSGGPKMTVTAVLPDRNYNVSYFSDRVVENATFSEEAMESFMDQNASTKMFDSLKDRVLEEFPRQKSPFFSAMSEYIPKAVVFDNFKMADGMISECVKNEILNTNSLLDERSHVEIRADLFKRSKLKASVIRGRGSVSVGEKLEKPTGFITCDVLRCLVSTMKSKSVYGAFSFVGGSEVVEELQKCENLDGIQLLKDFEPIRLRENRQNKQDYYSSYSVKGLEYIEPEMRYIDSVVQNPEYDYGRYEIGFLIGSDTLEFYKFEKQTLNVNGGTGNIICKYGHVLKDINPYAIIPIIFKRKLIE